MDISIEMVYVIVSVLILLISTRVVHAKSSHIFALLVSAGVIYYLYSINTQSTDNQINNLNHQADVLGDKASLFYIDANFIVFFYSIYDWRQLNENNFDNCLQAINNVFQIELDSETAPLQRSIDNWEVARDQAQEALNLLHGFIYSIDHPMLIRKLENLLIRLQQMLQGHLMNILNYCKAAEQLKGLPDVNTRYVQDIDAPKAYDPMHHSKTNDAFYYY